jgi:DNA-binding transcriptional LysR family regulator
MVNFKQLRVFLAVADQGSFSAASEALYLSQSVVSRHVAALEGRLDTALLDRGSRGVEMTEAGRLLASYARQLFALEDEARAMLEDLRELRSGRLRIGASMTIGNYLLPDILTEYHARYPQVEIELEIANTEAIQKDLHERTINVGFTEGFVEDEAFAVQAFANDELVPVTAPGTALAGIDRPALADLAAHPCITREPGSGTRAVLERRFAEYGVTLNYAMALGSTEAVKQAVLAGAGFTIASIHAVADELHAGRLVRLRPAGLAIRRPLHLLQLKHTHPTRAVSALTDLLGETDFR